MRRFNIYFIALFIGGAVAIGLPAFAEEKGDLGKPAEVKERGLPAPPYSCGSGVCLCVGQANCDQLTQPTPCKRQKFCLGQTASPPPQELQPSMKQPMQSTARITSGNFVICSCRAGQ